MRTEQEMLSLIIDTAKGDDRIRGAYMAGSRVNPNAARDIFQDYDIVYAVSETQSFREDRAWIDRFGERLYMQYPEEGAYAATDTTRCYGWLMQLADGSRLDLHVCTLDYLPESLAGDKAHRVLLDKDGCLPSEDRETDEAFWVRPLTEEQFLSTCNEFWWCTNNVAKGLWRDEILYVMDMLNLYIRPMLTRLLVFQVGLDTGFSVSVGKSAKQLHKWLPAEQWKQYLSTYSVATVPEAWRAVLVMCELFHKAALAAGAQAGFHYDAVEARNSCAYLVHVHGLPKDAKGVY